MSVTVADQHDGTLLISGATLTDQGDGTTLVGTEAIIVDQGDGTILIMDGAPVVLAHITGLSAANVWLVATASPDWTPGIASSNWSSYVG